MIDKAIDLSEAVYGKHMWPLMIEVSDYFSERITALYDDVENIRLVIDEKSNILATGKYLS